MIVVGILMVGIDNLVILFFWDGDYVLCDLFVDLFEDLDFDIVVVGGVFECVFCGIDLWFEFDFFFVEGVIV